MANQLKMADIQAIVALHQRGWSDRRNGVKYVKDNALKGMKFASLAR